MALKTIKINQKYLNKLVEGVANSSKDERFDKCYDLGCAIFGGLADDVVLPNGFEEYANGIADAYCDEDGYLADNYVALIGEYYYKKVKG